MAEFTIRAEFTSYKYTLLTKDRTIGKLLVNKYLFIWFVLY